MRKRRSVVLLVTEAQVVGPTQVRLAFNDGTRKTVDLTPELWGPVFEPLKDPAYFALGRFDPQLHTITWPNGADLAPEALWEMPDVSQNTE